LFGVLWLILQTFGIINFAKLAKTLRAPSGEWNKIWRTERQKQRKQRKRMKERNGKVGDF